MSATQVKSFIVNNVVYVGLALVFATLAVWLSDDGFLTVRNLTNIVVQATPISVMAVGMAFVLAAREIDLSIGAIVALSALSMAIALRSGLPTIVAILLALLAATVVGIANGLLVNFIGIPSFLTTLATMGIVTGIARIQSDLKSLPIVDDAFIFIFGSGRIGPVPVFVFWTLTAVLIGHLVLRHTQLGAWVLATGDDPAATSSLGIRVKRIRATVLLVSALTAGLAGLLYAGRIQGAAYTYGASDTLTVIAAAVVGGTSLFGGRASIPGAVAGSILLAMLSNGLLIAGFSVSQQIIAQGVVLLLAVSISLMGRKSS